MRRCGWCGRFVSYADQPIEGVNRYGETRMQLLCPLCAPHWVSLSERNQAGLAAADPERSNR